MEHEYHQHRKKQFEGRPPLQNPDKYSDPAQANVKIREIKKLQQKKAEIKAFVKDEMEKLQKWMDLENNRLDREIQDCRNYLYKYASTLRKKDPIRRTFTLPNGRLSFRKKQSSPNYDVKKVVSFLKRENLHHFIKEDLYKRELRRYFKERNGFLYDPNTGKRVEGVRLQQNGDGFYVYPE